MKKIVLQLELRDEKTKKKAMGAVSGFQGLNSYFSIAMKDKKLTVTADIDPVNLVIKLRKICPTEMISVNPTEMVDQKKEEAKKKDDQKKKEEDKKKDDQKKEEAKKKDDQKKKEEDKKKDDQKKEDKRKKEEPQKKRA